jgi:hypothetical protein
MSGPHRNPDRINTIGVVVVGICGAVLVYVTIVALEAFYVNDTSEIQTMADYGGQDTTAKSVRADQQQHINEYAPNNAVAGSPQTYRIRIDDAMKRVVDEAKVKPNELIPAVGPSDISTIKPVFGRPKIEVPPTPPPAGAAPPAGEGSAAPPAGAGSAEVAPPGQAPATPAAGAKTEPAPAAGSTPATPPGAKPAGKAGATTPAKPPAQPGAVQPKPPVTPKPPQPKAAGSGSGGHAP